MLVDRLTTKNFEIILVNLCEIKFVKHEKT